MSKMHSIISEIQKLRDNIPILPDRNNKNRYCIISNDGDLKTAYCFSVPIYDSAGILLDLRFKEKLNTLLPLALSNKRLYNTIDKS